MSIYILCWRPTRAFFIGPFDSTDAAATWATDPKNNPSDDPNWFVLPLVRDPHAPLEVIPPSVPMPNDTATWNLASQFHDGGDPRDDDGYTELEKKLRRMRGEEE